MSDGGLTYNARRRLRAQVIDEWCEPGTFPCCDPDQPFPIDCGGTALPRTLYATLTNFASPEVEGCRIEIDTLGSYPRIDAVPNIPTTVGALVRVNAWSNGSYPLTYAGLFGGFHYYLLQTTLAVQSGLARFDTVDNAGVATAGSLVTAKTALAGESDSLLWVNPADNSIAFGEPSDMGLDGTAYTALLAPAGCGYAIQCDVDHVHWFAGTMFGGNVGSIREAAVAALMGHATVAVPFNSIGLYPNVSGIVENSDYFATVADDIGRASTSSQYQVMRQLVLRIACEGAGAGEGSVHATSAVRRTWNYNSVEAVRTIMLSGPASATRQAHEVFNHQGIFFDGNFSRNIAIYSAPGDPVYMKSVPEPFPSPSDPLIEITP